MNTNSTLYSLFKVDKPMIGNLHCLPLPGSPNYEAGGMQRAIQHALEEAHVMAEEGLDAVIVENAGDIPYLPPEKIGYETVAAMTAIVNEIQNALDFPLGVLCLGNGAIASFAVAAATKASFIRVNLWAHAYVGIEGFMNGPAPEALRYRSNIRANDVRVFADVHVKFGAHTITSDRPIPELAQDVENFGGEVLVATGARTGDPTNIEEVKLIKKGTNREVIIGSGLNPENASKLLEVADGAIVGSYLKETGHWTGRTSPQNVRNLMRVVRKIRGES